MSEYFSELSDTENAVIAVARTAGFAGYFPAHRASATLKAARRFLCNRGISLDGYSGFRQEKAINRILDDVAALPAVDLSEEGGA